MVYIDIENLDFGYKKNSLVLRTLSLKILEEGVYAIIGKNGSGKTTLFKILIKYLTNYNGTVKILGKNLKEIPLNEIPNIFGFLESEIPIIPLTVKEILSWGKPKNSSKEDNFEKFVTELKMNEIINENFENLSSGEKKRVLLGRVFMQSPRIVLIDEPFNFLDPKYKIDVIDIIKHLSLEKPVFITTHELEIVEYIADKILILKDGTITTIKKPFQIRNNTQIKEAFSIERNKEPLFDNIYGNKKI